jgi:hypothetical protein
MVMELFFTIGTIILAVVLLLAGPFHLYNQRRLHKRIELLEHCHVELESFYKEVTVSQGSNFTALALASWILLIVAVAYLYFLIPTFLPYSYMQIPVMASSPLGFALFGIIVSILVAAIILLLDKLPEKYRAFKPTELYSFYSISKGIKRIISLAVIALCICIFSSAYLGTIYPYHSAQAEFISLILLLGSACVLIMPIYKETWEGRR